VNHAARAELLLVVLEIAGVGLSEALVIALLRLLLGIQVVEIAKEFVETMSSGKVLVAVAEVPRWFLPK
jgi:hypothetical protein